MTGIEPDGSGRGSLRAANQRLRELLDELYAETPDACPTEEQVSAAAELLGLQ